MTEEIETQPGEKQDTSEVVPEPSHFTTPPRWREKLKPHKWRILGGVLGILVFAGAVFGAYKIGQRQTHPEPAEGPTPTPVVVVTPTPDSTTDWKTYTNTKYGYSIKYLKEWFLEEGVDLVKLYNQDPNVHKFERTREISLGALDYPKEDFIFDINVIENVIPEPDLAQRSTIEIGGLDGAKGILTGGEGEKILMGYVIKDGKTYTFYGRPADSTQKDYFNLMLSTFRFCDPCPQFMLPHPEACKDGTWVAGEIDECGCQGPPRCLRETTP